MTRRKRRSSRRSNPTPSTDRSATHLGVAWYREDQWARLRELASDTPELEERHADWLHSAEETIGTLQAEGITVEKVPIDVDAAAEWASRRNRPFDGKARSVYVVELMRGHTGDGPNDAG